jgi:hypothetical protein
VMCTHPAIAFGAGGFMLACWTEAGAVMQRLGPDAQLIGSSVLIGESIALPSIAATTDGYVVGYAQPQALAAAQRVDAQLARLGSPLTFGTVLASPEVAVTFSAGLIGVSYIQPDGSAAAAIEGHSPITIPASSLRGQVSIAPASNGLVAAWTDTSFIGIAAVGTDGTQLGSTLQLDISSSDAASVLVTTAQGVLLVTTVTLDHSPIVTRMLRCP